MQGFITYLKNVRAELGHVVWPSRNQTLIHTGIIILLSILTALLITALDYLFTGIVAGLISG